MITGSFLKLFYLLYNTGMTLHSPSFTIWSTLIRLFLACVSAGVIGYGRSQRGRSAGIRIYMLTGIGAALSIMISLYLYTMFMGPWHPATETVTLRLDVSRYAAQVLSGIGFLVAGSIIAVEYRHIEGLTTAAGMFASVCMGFAAGAGFYECVIVALILILITLNIMGTLEIQFKRSHRNITIYVELESLEDVDELTSLITERGHTILDIDVERTEKIKNRYPSLILFLNLSKNRPSHSEVLSTIAELPYVYAVEERIS